MVTVRVASSGKLAKWHFVWMLGSVCVKHAEKLLGRQSYGECPYGICNWDIWWMNNFISTASLDIISVDKDKKQPIKCWKSPGIFEFWNFGRILQHCEMGLFSTIWLISLEKHDRIFIKKFVVDVYLWTRTSPLSFGNHRDSRSGPIHLMTAFMSTVRLSVVFCVLPRWFVLSLLCLKLYEYWRP